MFKRKEREERDRLISEVRVVRYTRDAMAEIAKNADPPDRFRDSDYDEAVRPYNWIDVAADGVGATLAKRGVTLDKDAVVRQILVDSRAVSERGYAGLPFAEVADDACMRNAPYPDTEMEERIAEAGLNVSEWEYVLSLNIAPKKGDYDARLPEETRKALAGYLEGIAGKGFSVHAGRYLAGMDAYARDRDRFTEMAREALSRGREIKYAAYDVLKVRDDRLMRVCVPITVRETHANTAIPADEILRYMSPGKGAEPDREHFGRYLWMMNPGLGPDEETRMKDFRFEEAGMLLREAIEPIVAGNSSWHFTLLPSSLAEEVERRVDAAARCMARGRRRQGRR